MTASLNSSRDLMTLCARPLERDAIAAHALASGLKPREILSLLDTIERWQGLGYTAGGNAQIDEAVARLRQTPDSAPADEAKS